MILDNANIIVLEVQQLETLFLLKHCRLSKFDLFGFLPVFGASQKNFVLEKMIPSEERLSDKGMKSDSSGLAVFELIMSPTLLSMLFCTLFDGLLTKVLTYVEIIDIRVC